MAGERAVIIAHSRIKDAEDARNFMAERHACKRREAVKAWDKAVKALGEVDPSNIGYAIDFAISDRCIKYGDAVKDLQYAFRGIGFWEGVSPLGVAAGGRS